MTHVLSELRQNVQMFLTVEIFVAAHASDRVCDFGGTFEDTLLAAASAKKSVQIRERAYNRSSFYTSNFLNHVFEVR